MTYTDLEFEFPDRTVLRLSRADGAVVEFVERNDADARGGDARWFSHRGALTWEQLVSRLRSADSWMPVTPAPAGLDALTEVRGWFHAALASGDLEAARAVEQAGQALAVVLRLPELTWLPEEPAAGRQPTPAGIVVAEPEPTPIQRWMRLQGIAATWLRERVETVRAGLKAA
ncbi:hypothetical protein [Micromonospora maritima]|uniref:hypothetical protein n=1 Tax=Micromonospora maritima TaxID=986711 RepID=UPI00157C0DFA|nr:hypothetical protein [Micromonospora maritima]